MLGQAPPPDIDPHIWQLVQQLGQSPDASTPTLPPSTMGPPPPQDTPPPPVAQQPYVQADQLTAQAAPPPDPTSGMSPMKAALYKGIQGFGQGLAYSHTPGGYAGHVQQQYENERQREQDLLNRAKELRGEGLAQSQLNQRANEAQLERDRQQQEFQATQDFRKQQLEQGKFASGAQGIYDTRTGELIHPSTTSGLPNSIEALEMTDWLRKNPGKTPSDWYDYKQTQGGEPLYPVMKNGAAVYAPRSQAAGQTAPPPNQQFLPGPTGAIEAVGNPRSGAITPIQNPGGARRTAVPAGEMDKQRDLENSVRKLDELGTLFKPDFVGPTTGRYLKVKSMLPESMASLPPGYTDFMALQSDLKNSIIKLITGAQMGQQEAARILQQVPVETDRPDMWQSKYKQTQANAQNLLNIITQQTGLPTQQAQPTAPATGGWKIKSVRALMQKTYTVEAPDGHTIEIEGPEGASQDEVIAQAQRLYQPQQTQAAPAPEPSLLDRVKSYMPSPRTALRVGGGLAGGAIGAVGGTIMGTPIGAVPGAAVGGAAGASIGESTYQIAKRLMGQPVVNTPGEAAQEAAGALTQGALQEAIPAFMTSKAPAMLEKSAASKVGEAVRVGRESLGVKQNVAKVAEGVVQDFPVSATSANLLTKLETNMTKSIAKNEVAYQAAQASGVRFQSAPVAQALEQEVGQISHGGSPIPGLEPRVSAYQQVIDWLNQNPTFSVSDFRKAKQAWDSTVNFNRAGLGPDPAKVEALEKAAGTVRDAIHQALPNVAKTDAETHAWSTLYQALKRSTDKTFGVEAAATMLPRSALGGSIGGATAYAEGKSPYEGALIGASLGALTKTTAWNTLSVRERAILIKALQSSAAPAITKGLSAIGSGLAEGATQ